MISNADRLRDAYPSDLEPSLPDSCRRYSNQMWPSDTGMPVLYLETQVDVNNDNVAFNNESVELRMHRYEVDNHKEAGFPNTAICYYIV